MILDRRYYISSALSYIHSEYRMEDKIEILDDFSPSFEELMDFIDADVFDCITNECLQKAVDERDKKSIRTIAYAVRTFIDSKNSYYWSFNTPHNELPWGELCEKALANISESRTFTYGTYNNKTMLIEYREALKHCCHNHPEQWLAQNILGQRLYAKLLGDKEALDEVLRYFRSKSFEIREIFSVESIKKDKTGSEYVDRLGIHAILEYNLNQILEQHGMSWYNK